MSQNITNLIILFQNSDKSNYFLVASQLAEAVDYLAELQDRLEVAELQRQLCMELVATSTSTAVCTSTTFSHAAVEQALNELTRGPLLPASELFASYADPFELHESKLMLLHFAGEAVSPLASFF